MAQRNIAEILFPVNEEIGYQRGDELAQRAAAALADRFDAPTIIALTDALSFVDRVGGQLYITALRRKVDRLGNFVSDEQEGEFRSAGLAFLYESRDAKVKRARGPQAAFGYPVDDTSAPAVEIEAPGEDGYALRDEIEAEAGAAAEEGPDLSLPEPDPDEVEDPEPVAVE